MPPDAPAAPGPARSTAADARFGYAAALGTAVATLATFAVALATPPISGPMCRAGCISYPYLDIAARFPRDYVWMFLALPATLLYLAFAIALQARAAPDRRLLAQLGVALALMAALTLFGNYFLQLAVIQPSVLAGETAGLALWTQYNPHGLFIALEELGYLLMSLSLACLAPSRAQPARLARLTGWIFRGGLVANLGALAWLLLAYGHQRSYRFEVTAISIAWLTLIAGAALMALVFRRERAATE